MVIRSMDTKPIIPKNGDKYRNNRGTFMFRNGAWVLMRIINRN